MFDLPLLPRSLEAAERDLAHPREKVRLEAVDDLGKFTDSHEERGARIRLLVRALSDGSLNVRKRALLRLGDHRDARAVSALLPLLRETELELRQFAVLALGDSGTEGDEEVLAALRPILLASEPRLRFQATAALFRLEPATRTSTLGSALADADAEIRYLGLELLQEFSREVPREFAARLDELTRDEDERVRLLAEVLASEANLGGPTSEIERAISSTKAPREGSLLERAIEQAGIRRLEGVRAALDRRAFGFFTKDRFELSALAALGAFGDERALARLRKGLAARSMVLSHAVALAVARGRVTTLFPELRRFHDARGHRDEFASEEIVVALTGTAWALGEQR